MEKKPMKQITVRVAVADDAPIIAALTMAIGENSAERLYLSLGFRRVEVRKFIGHDMWHLQYVSEAE